ncbi:MAG: glycosyltransferase family 2 protein [Armatimonadetes bacterium]|nr:glycosyltransferase family 2 protein [Armatimonadota bacterium]
MLSICIANWNTRDLLRACLQSLRANAPAVPHEILVTDNGSRVGTAGMVAAEFPAVRLFVNDANLGYAAGNNQLLRAARGRWLLLLNSDTEIDPALDPRALDTLVAHLEAHPFVGAVAARLVHPDGRTQRSCRGFPTAGAMAAEWTGLARLCPDRLGAYRMRGFDHQSFRTVDQPMAACLLLRRRAMQRIGLIDEQFPIFFNDVDLCLRLRRDGWRVDYLPAASIIHHGGASTRQLPLRMLRESRDSLLAFYEKQQGEGWGEVLSSLAGARPPPAPSLARRG